MKRNKRNKKLFKNFLALLDLVRVANDGGDPKIPKNRCPLLYT